MKNKFLEYYTPSQEEFKEMWKDCIFSVDTNILLSFYRYPYDLTTKLIEIFKKTGDRLWIPYHVGLEYNRRKHDIKHERHEVRTRITNVFKTAAAQITNEKNRHPYIDTATIAQKVATLEKRIDKKLQEDSSKFDFNSIDEEIRNLFDGRIGSGFPPERLQQIYEEGKKRYAEKIPPGFMDRVAQEDFVDQYGDLVIWNEMMEKAKVEKKPIIYISDDQKEDWYWEKHNKKLGPRPELIREMMTYSKVRYYSYDVENFIKRASEEFSITVDSELLTQIKEVKEDNRTKIVHLEDVGEATSTDILPNEVVQGSPEIPEDDDFNVETSDPPPIVHGNKGSKKKK